MSLEDGLFENPDKQENELEIQRTEATVGIKKDTSAILDVLYRFDGATIDKLAKLERAEKIGQKQQVRQSHTIAQALGENTAILEETKSERQKQNNSQKQAQKRAETVERKQKKEQRAQQSVSTDSKGKQQQKSKTEKEKLPDGWTRDKDGRARKANGQYASEDELKKHGISNPTSKEDTEEEADKQKMLDVLGGIKDAVGESENIDPIIDGFREIYAPLENVTEVAGRGLDKLFSSSKDDEQENGRRWRDRFFSFSRKSEKNAEKKQNKIINWLKELYEKPENGKGSILGRLLSLLMRLPILLVGGLGKGLLRLFRGVLGGLFKGGKGLLSLGGGLLGGAMKFGKGILRKIPVIGSLLALADGIGGLFDNTRDENGKSNRGKRVGGSIGMLAGGALGSFLGPVGTIAGAMIGDWIGQQVGEWVADFDWSIMGTKIKGAWNNAVDWVKTTWNAIDWGGIGNSVKNAWNGAKEWVKSTWDSIDFGTFGVSVKTVWTPVKDFIVDSWNKIDWSSIGESIKSGWNSALDWISKTWESLDLSSKWDKTKAFVSDSFDTIKNSAVAVKNTAVEWGWKAADYVGNKASDVWNWAISPFSSSSSADNETDDIERSLDASAEYQKDQLTKLSDSQTIFETIRDILGDILLLLRDSVSAGSVTNNADPISGEPSILGSLKDEHGIPLVSGAAVDPKTGKKIQYTQGAFLGGKINGLTAEQTEMAMNALSARESGGILNNEKNKFGYLGLYQFGAEALSGVGYIDKRAYERTVAPYRRKNSEGKTYLDKSWWNGGHQAFLANNANWKIPGGKQAFLNSKQLQDKAAVNLMNSNIKYLKKSGVKFNSAEDIVGAGFAAHLKGAGKAKELILEGKNSKDAYNTDAAYYYQYGRNSLGGGKNVLIASTAPVATNVALGGVSAPKGNIATASLPLPSMALPTFDPNAIATKINKEANAEIKSSMKPNNQQAQTATTSGVDPIIALLTQDVSDRRIAHIVTGGIAFRRI